MHLLSLTTLCQSVDEKETENKKESVNSEGNKNWESKIKGLFLDIILPIFIILELIDQP